MTTRTLCTLIRSDFEEMPGLCLTKAQLQRLWHLDDATREEVIRRLVSEGFLFQTQDGYRHSAGASV
jgi:hypothetical protein